MNYIFYIVYKLYNLHRLYVYRIISEILPNRTKRPVVLVTELAKEQSQCFNFTHTNLSLELVKHIYFYNDLPEQLKDSIAVKNEDNLKVIVLDVFGKLNEASCKFYSVSVHSILLM